SSIVAEVVALLIFVAISLYQTMQVPDQLMDEIADMLFISDVTVSPGQQLDELSDEFDIQYQLIDQQQVLTQSKNFQVGNLSSKIKNNASEGYDFIWQDQQLWRMYTAEDSELNMSVLVLQPVGERFKDLVQNVMGYGLILVLLW